MTGTIMREHMEPLGVTTTVSVHLAEDPATEKRQQTVTVKIAATHQPVPPSAGELPFAAVEFDGLTVTPYVDESGGRTRVAYGIRARGVQAPRERGGTAAPPATRRWRDA